MKDQTDSSPQETGVFPNWLTRIMPLVSLFLGAAALWYTWFRGHEMLNTADVPWYEWIRPAFTLLIGWMCLVSALLFLLGLKSAWHWLKGGLSLVPLMLMSNLVIAASRAVIGLFQGKALPLLEHLFTNPKNLIIPVIVIALGLLGSLSKMETKNKE